ncbi:putative leucine-rich repeat domain superfamily [Helianthus annuus]|nr:putative leucine-rich repeat domain superfamily [Helianthus annuus]
MPLFRWPLVLLLPCRSHQVKEIWVSPQNLATIQGNPNLIVSQHIWCGSGSCSVVAGRLFKGLHCLHLTSLDLYYCRNITDRAMYALAHIRVKNRNQMWNGVKTGDEDENGLMSLNISQCTALTPPAVQALCDSFPALHTCPGRHSLMISGCLNPTSIPCACAFQAHHEVNTLTHHAY